MRMLLIEIYNIFTMLVGVFILFKLLSKNEVKYKKSNYLLWITIFVIYIIGVINVTGLSTLAQAHGYNFKIFRNTINLDLFTTDNYNFRMYYLNILMFIPLGVLLPIVYKSKVFIKTMMMAMLFTSFIEFSQLFNSRSTDIDDIILNIIGCFIGYIIYSVLSLIIPRLKRNDINMKYEPAFIILFMYFSRFFLMIFK